MIDARLLTYREYIPWADSVIMSLEHPPIWILDLAVKEYFAAARDVVATFARSEPFENLSPDLWTDEYIAAIYLRYERRELSWASFLEMAGAASDGGGGRHDCEHFYMMLNQYAESNFAEPLEAQQKRAAQIDYKELIHSVRATFDIIKDCQRTS
jgi:hypothetical protein